jgi:Flp pilus assembly protein TadD
MGHIERISFLLQGLGASAEKQGRFVEAKRRWVEALNLAREINFRDRIAALLHNLAGLASSQHDYTQAEIYFQEGLEHRTV